MIVFLILFHRVKRERCRWRHLNLVPRKKPVRVKATSKLKEKAAVKKSSVQQRIYSEGKGP